MIPQKNVKIQGVFTSKEPKERIGNTRNAAIRKLNSIDDEFFDEFLADCTLYHIVNNCSSSSNDGISDEMIIKHNDSFDHDEVTCTIIIESIRLLEWEEDQLLTTAIEAADFHRRTRWKLLWCPWHLPYQAPRTNGTRTMQQLP